MMLLCLDRDRGRMAGTIHPRSFLPDTVSCTVTPTARPQGFLSQVSLSAEGSNLKETHDFVSLSAVSWQAWAWKQRCLRIILKYWLHIHKTRFTEFKQALWYRIVSAKPLGSVSQKQILNYCSPSTLCICSPQRASPRSARLNCSSHTEISKA